MACVVGKSAVNLEQAIADVMQMAAAELESTGCGVVQAGATPQAVLQHLLALPALKGAVQKVAKGAPAQPAASSVQQEQPHPAQAGEGEQAEKMDEDGGGTGIKRPGAGVNHDDQPLPAGFHLPEGDTPNESGGEASSEDDDETLGDVARHFHAAVGADGAGKALNDFKVVARRVRGKTKGSPQSA